MRSVNKVILIGNLTRDPTLRQTKSSGPSSDFCTFGMATNRSWKVRKPNDESGDSNERREETEFHDIVVWGPRARFHNELLRKGVLVYVEGRLKRREKIDANNQKHYFFEIVAEDIIKLEKHKPNEESRRDSASFKPASPELDLNSAASAPANEKESDLLEPTTSPAPEAEAAPAPNPESPKEQPEAAASEKTKPGNVNF